jgi:hypothetical protein
MYSKKLADPPHTGDFLKLWLLPLLLNGNPSILPEKYSSDQLTNLP